MLARVFYNILTYFRIWHIHHWHSSIQRQLLKGSFDSSFWPPCASMTTCHIFASRITSASSARRSKLERCKKRDTRKLFPICLYKNELLRKFYNGCFSLVLERGQAAMMTLKRAGTGENSFIYCGMYTWRFTWSLKNIAVSLQDNGVHIMTVSPRVCNKSIRFVAASCLSVTASWQQSDVFITIWFTMRINLKWN